MDAPIAIDPRMQDATAALTIAAAALADAIEQDAAAERASSTAREQLSAAKTAYNRALNDVVGCADPRMRRSEQQLLRDGHIRRVDMAAMPSAELHFDPPPPVSRPPVLMPSDIVSDRPALASRH